MNHDDDPSAGETLPVGGVAAVTASGQGGPQHGGTSLSRNNDGLRVDVLEDEPPLPRRAPGTVSTLFGTYSGPIPPPEHLGKLAKIDPSLVDRVVKMAEKEQEHRHSMERQEQANEMQLSMTAIQTAASATKRGTLAAVTVALSGLAVACALGLCEQPWAAVGVGGVTLVSMVGMFITRTWGERKGTGDAASTLDPFEQGGRALPAPATPPPTTTTDGPRAR